MLRLMLTRRWMLRHLLVIVVVAVFLGLGWWQWGRGEQGNLRSFAYAVEWPVFAGFVVFMWWRTLRMEAHPPEDGQPGGEAGVTGGAMTDRSVMARQAVASSVDEEPDEELAAYNRYLAWLEENDRQRQR